MTRFDLEMVSGETRTIAVTAVYGDGTPVDLAGATIRYAAGLPTPLQKSLGDGITVTDEAGGEFEIVLAQDDTLGVGGYGRHECKVMLASGHVSVAFAGWVLVRLSVIGEIEAAQEPEAT